MNSFDGQQIDTWFKHLYINGCAQGLRNISADMYFPREVTDRKLCNIFYIFLIYN